jgi:hypothetical protein
LSATNVFKIRVENPPPIDLISISNGVPFLVMTNLQSYHSYLIEFAPSVDPTNWATLTRTSFGSKKITVTDTSAVGGVMRFYRLRSQLWECYAGESCP